MIYGYARVSTAAQDETGQVRRLKEAGCEKVFREKITGTTADRPQLAQLTKKLEVGDVVITPAVDRLSRDTTDLLVIAREMQRAGAGIRSLAEPYLDTTSDFAEIVFAILGVAAKLERRRILERTARGRADAKEKGQIRPQADPHPAPAEEARKRLEAGETQRASHAATMSVRARFRGFNMTTAVEGFYSAYITGKEGQGFAIIIFMARSIIGADAGGFLFDGQYAEDDDGTSVSLAIKAPANAPRVQGGLTGPQGEETHLNFRLPPNFTCREFIRIETPRGPVNVRFVKLRSMSA
jgi:DNA invertase Pin-like site-specific DNA recombinase